MSIFELIMDGTKLFEKTMILRPLFEVYLIKSLNLVSDTFDFQSKPTTLKRLARSQIFRLSQQLLELITDWTNLLKMIQSKFNAYI